MILLWAQSRNPTDPTSQTPMPGAGGSARLEPWPGLSPKLPIGTILLLISILGIIVVIVVSAIIEIIAILSGYYSRKSYNFFLKLLLFCNQYFFLLLLLLLLLLNNAALRTHRHVNDCLAPAQGAWKEAEALSSLPESLGAVPSFHTY